MATAVHSMTLGQNMMIPNNCVILSANMISNKSQQQMYGKRPIAPNPSQTVLTSNGANQVINLPKKKYNYGSMPYPATQTVSVQRRNARERNRVKQVNNGFSTLRQHIPSTVITALTKGGGRGAAKKLSKVDTLRLAVEYIRSLKDMLDDNENNESTSGASSSGSSYYSDKSQHLLQSIPRSEASLSPTPSYESESSSAVSYTPNHIQGHQMNFKQEPFDCFAEQSTSPVPSYHQTEVMQLHQQIYPPASTPYKPVPHHLYQSYSPVSNDDDEILDAIAWWQEQ